MCGHANFHQVNNISKQSFASLAVISLRYKHLAAPFARLNLVCARDLQTIWLVLFIHTHSWPCHHRRLGWSLWTQRMQRRTEEETPWPHHRRTSRIMVVVVVMLFLCAQTLPCQCLHVCGVLDLLDLADLPVIGSECIFDAVFDTVRVIVL